MTRYETMIDLFDTHAHFEGTAAEIAAQLDRARAAGVTHVMAVGGSAELNADDDTLGLLREIPSKGIIHCFTGFPDHCRQFLDLGFYVSISGIVTFKAAANVRESALVVPDDRILVETDSPFLAPVPMRGQANEPAFVVHTAKFLAELRKTPFETFAALTTANARSVLGLGSGRVRHDCHSKLPQ